MAEQLDLDLPLKVILTNTSSTTKSFVPYNENFISCINSGDILEIQVANSEEALFYIQQATAGLTIVSEEIPYGRCPVVTFNQLEGNYKDSVAVKLNCSDANAKIYYTTNGTTPTNTSTEYNRRSNGITISNTTTLKAIAYETLEYTHPSIVTTITYTILKPHTLIISDGSHVTTTVTLNGVTKRSNSTVYDQDILSISAAPAATYSITDFRINNESYDAPINPISYVVDGANVSIISKAILTSQIISTNDVLHDITFNITLSPHIDDDIAIGTEVPLLKVGNSDLLKLKLVVAQGLQLIGNINATDYILYDEADGGWNNGTKAVEFNAALAGAQDSAVTVSTVTIPTLYGWQTYAHK